MVITIQSQIYAFLVTVYGGFVLGFIYDIFKVTRQVFRLRKTFSNIADIIFWLFGTITMLYFMYISNYVEIRFYSFLGFAIGIILYYVLLSYFITQALIGVFEFTIKFLRKMAEIIIYPIRIVVNFIIVPYRFTKKILTLPVAFLKNNLTHFKIFKRKK
ncbi:spore cortex biosynthesis protein YabQ [Thermoanaerobacter mathranii subsp. mathranii str. A3]|uniref:Spore cortex biosynthesis protein YabQ n=2 Tax=Thermoanaerobacter TaxID=1754 RepID=D3T5H6_THEIA|nr:MULTISPECIES: spore cortex biosynthesis protein YabQ [Thermoanaerobacter]ADD03349.1 spore cortex biosynthesis protein YabQ [Thermoanaerobacter italicus Ab9]ADH61726.1 spore cortex biosynthesis protein YabQ [Thermoanaerobacter mathranii subsp. mathranii str. A3]